MVQHSDADSQYVAFHCTERLTAACAIASIGTIDNLGLGTLRSVHGFHHQRLHSSIG